MCPFPHPVICPLHPLHHTPIPSNGPSLILYCEQLHSAEPWPKIPTGLTFRMTLCLILLGLQVLGYPTLWHFSPFITNPLKTLKSRDQVCLSWGLMTERKKMKEVVGAGRKIRALGRVWQGCNLPASSALWIAQFWANAFLSFEGLNIYMPLRSACWNSNLQYEGLKQQGFGKVSFASKALMDEISISFKEEQEAPLTLPTWEVTANKGCLWGGRFSEGTESACTFISNLLIFRRN